VTARPVRHARATFGIATVASGLAVVACASVALADADGIRGSDAVMAASDPAAVLLLVSAVRAQRERDYSGTEYVCAWSDGAAATSVVTVDHRAGAGTTVRVQPSATAPGRTMQEPDRLDQAAPVDPLAVSAVDDGPLDLLRRNYVLSTGAIDDSTVQVQARRHDATMAATFWIDRDSGLLVRREVFDNSGRLVRASAFVELRLTAGATTTTSAAPVAAALPDEATLARADVMTMRRAGWVLPAQLPGGMVLYDARQQGDGDGRVVHLSYSDGLSTMSVFVQRGRLNTGSVARWSRQRMGGPVYVHDYGLGRRVTWTGGGHVYTVVADAPSTAVAAVVTALPHGEHHRGTWGRIKHGLQRLGSWLNPFG
jgi:sigma-E factor negative regulatory protein RseB